MLIHCSVIKKQQHKSRKRLRPAACWSQFAPCSSFLWLPGRLFEPGVLRQAAHDVHIANGLSGCAPGEIIDNGDDDQPPSPLIDPPAEVAVVTAPDLKRNGQMLSITEADEKLIPVEAPEGLLYVRGPHSLLQIGVNRAQNTAAHRDKMRGEIDRHLSSGQNAQFLLDFRRVA